MNLNLFFFVHTHTHTKVSSADHSSIIRQTAPLFLGNFHEVNSLCPLHIKAINRQEFYILYVYVCGI